MKRVVLIEANPDIEKARLSVQEADVPKPRHNQVLVKVLAAPVNPSDDGLWLKPPRRGYPAPLGNEGSGIVVASGGGLMADRLVGRKVAMITEMRTWSQYCVIGAMEGVFELPDEVDAKSACSFFVNPFTVCGIVETAKECGGGAFIHTAAASQLGQMMVKYCKMEGVCLVNVVRREEQADLLRGMGAEHVIVTGKQGWEDELSAKIKQLNIRCAFDAVSGDLTGSLLALIPWGGSVYVYGRLAPEKTGNIDPLALIYMKKQLKGFLVTDWLMKGGKIRALMRSVQTANKVRKYLSTVFASDFKDTSMEDLHATYVKSKKQGLTGIKVRVLPNGSV